MTKPRIKFRLFIRLLRRPRVAPADECERCFGEPPKASLAAGGMSAHTGKYKIVWRITPTSMPKLSQKISACFTSRSTLVVLIILAVALMLTGCRSKSLTGKKEVQEVIPVRVMRVELKDIYKTLEYAGNIKAEEEAVVYPRVSGKIIEKVKEDGSKVKKGDTLFYIDRDEVGLKFEKAPVESPLDGVVGRIYVDIGANVASQTPVALIVSMDKVKIGLSIPEKYIPQVSLGQNAAIIVDAYTEKFKGVVTKISPVLDTDTRSAPAEITVDNKGHLLKSGMFARVSLIIDESKAAPIVLKESIMGKSPDAYVYVIENNKAILRNVKLGIRQDGYFEVIDGIREGDAVVVMGQQRLKDGIDVKAEY